MRCPIGVVHGRDTILRSPLSRLVMAYTFDLPDRWRKAGLEGKGARVGAG